MDLARLSNLSPDQLIKRLGEEAKPHEEELIDSDLPEPSPIFVVGLPRSGTTVTYQLLASTGDVGYISNFLARFWEAPVLGALIEQAVGIRENHGPDSFESDFGRTKGWHEAHEFGYFWDRWFKDLSETNNIPQDELAKVDAGALRREIAGLEQVFGKPGGFANNAWCTLQASWLAEVFPEALFIVCRRKPIYIAQSLYQGRIERKGSHEEWWSTKPRVYSRLEDQPWAEQIAGQVNALITEMDEELEKVPDERIIERPYTDFCKDPVRFLEEVGEASKGCDPTVGQDQNLSQIESTNRERIPSKAFEEISEALHEEEVR